MREKRNLPHQPGDIVLLEFPGVNVTKVRPAVILSSRKYHLNRPDIIVGLITSQVVRATSVTDYVLSDWQKSGLDRPSAYRSFLVTVPGTAVWSKLGKLSPRDWHGVASRLKIAIAV